LVEKKDRTSRLSVAEKRQCIQSDHPELSVARQCELIGLSRSSYYRGALIGTESEENLMLMRLIDEEYTRHPFYGSRKLRDYLRRQGYNVNRKRVQRLMQRMGLVSIAPKPNTSRPSPSHKVYPYLLKGLAINRSNQVWCSDITYIPLNRGFVFLTVVMDWHSRHVLSWEVSVTLEAHFCVSALESALRRYGRPEIFNTDQGSQYTGQSFTGVLKDHEVQISMDGKGRALDNIMVERLWRSVKYEDVYVKDYGGVPELLDGLRTYFDFYNHERPHQGLGSKTPAEVYYGEHDIVLAA
jgi:putative transposase